MQQYIIRSAGVKRDTKFLCQAARFFFASPPKCMNLKTFSFQQWDEHSGCTPCAKYTDSRQHGSATQCDLMDESWPASLTSQPQTIHLSRPELQVNGSLPMNMKVQTVKADSYCCFQELKNSSISTSMICLPAMVNVSPNRTNASDESPAKFFFIWSLLQPLTSYPAKYFTCLSIVGPHPPNVNVISISEALCAKCTINTGRINVSNTI